MDYKKLLEESYTRESTPQDGMMHSESRLEFLADHVFDFTTYENYASILFAFKAVEVCRAINERKTFEYIMNGQNNIWFLLMCNMPFFVEKLNWGTSIRGAFWDVTHPVNSVYQFEFTSTGLWQGDEQLLKLTFDKDEEWEEFMKAVVTFAEPDMESVKPEELV